MKTNKIIIGLAAVALTACSHDEYDGPDYQGGKLTVTGSVAPVVSRASGTNWDAGDAIGVSDDANVSNVKFTTTGDGAFTSEEPVYVLGNQEHTYTAYYPYNAEVNANKTAVAFTMPEDFLWAQTTATRENPQANFVFAHKMSRICIAVKDQSHKETPADAMITVGDLALGGSFETATGAVTPSTTLEKTTSAFTLEKETGILLPPQTLATALKVTLEYDGKIYAGSINPTQLVEGTEYHYTIDLSGADPSVPLTISSATITGWSSVDNGNIDVSEQERPREPNTLEVGDYLLKDGTVIDRNDADFAAKKAEIVGVVYYVGNPQPSALYGYEESKDALKRLFPSSTNGLAVALNNGQEAPARFASRKFNFKTGWFDVEANVEKAAGLIVTGLNLSKLPTEILGFNNTAVIKEATAQLGGSSAEGETGTADLVAMLDAFQTANAVSGASTWYVPSYAELLAVQTNYTVVAAAITKAGGSIPSFAEFTEATTEHFYWSSDLRGDSYNWVSPLVSTTEDVKLYVGRNSSSNKGYFRFSIAF